MKYMTEQRKLLLAFLQGHPDKQYTVDELTAALQEKADISASSVYRNINEMVQDGSVTRINIGSRQCAYQYIGTSKCSQHLHLKCEECGQLFHMKDEAMSDLLGSIKDANSFKVDMKKSILYGRCEDCD